MARVLPDPLRRGVATTLAVLSALALAALTAVFLNTGRGQVVDDLGRDSTATGAAADYSEQFLTVLSTGVVVACLAGLALVALVQRRWQEALGALVLVAGANITTQVAKAALARPDFGVDVGAPNSLPSGHTTVAASLGAAALLVAPARWRPAVAVPAAGYAAATGVATLFGGWHRPADVLAALAVVGAWTLAVSAALPLRSPTEAEHPTAEPSVTEEPTPPRPAPGQVAAVRLLAVGTALGGVVAVGGLTLALAGWIDPDTPALLRYAGPSCAVVAGACALFWAALLVAPPGVDRTPVLS
jgi:membrane-associated phospholipid phosphatase